MEFKPKHSRWSEGMIWVMALTPFTLFFYLWSGKQEVNVWTLVAGVLFLAAGFCYIYVQKYTRYLFTQNKLVIKTGILNRGISYDNIHSVYVSRWRRGGVRDPAGPMTIIFGKAANVTVQPENPKKFLTLLRERCSSLDIQ